MPPNYGQTLTPAGARRARRRSSTRACTEGSSDGREACAPRAGTGRSSSSSSGSRSRSRCCAGLRAVFGADPVYDGDGVLQVALLIDAAVVPRRHRLLRLLAALGRAASTSSTTTRTTARTRWKDYFKVNTDHKVIGIQYICVSFFFMFVGGLMAMLVRAELAAAGPPVRRREHLQRALLGPRVDPDLPVRHPGLRGDRELRAAADDRRAGHGVPASERAVVLDAADGRRDDAAVVPGPGRLVRGRLDGLRPALGRRADRAGVLHDRRAVRRRVVDRDRAELPGHDHHDARARA